MRPKLKITGPGTHEQVRDAFRKESDPKRRRKLQAIRLGFMGEHTTEEIAEIVGCAKSSVTAWVKAYREGDIEGLLTTHYKPGRERAQAVLLASDGDHSYEQIAQSVGRARSTIQQWIASFVRDGVNAFFSRQGQGGGRPSPLNDEENTESL